MKKYLFTVGLMLIGIGLTCQNAWINEFHYDDAGSDSDEVVEIVIENPGNYTLSLFEIYLYNGNGGTYYGTESADNFTVGNTEGNYTFYYWYPSSMQNGAPDGLALVYDGTLISGQFLSYEGTFTATDGPASGFISVDIGVMESGSPEGYSLQLAGTGSQYSDFSWQPPATATVGLLNNGQTLGTTTTSNESDIVKTFGWSEAVNIDYSLFNASSGLTTTNSIEVASFTIRDGGTSSPDADSEPTALTSITFSILNYENIEALAIFDGATNILEVTPITSSTLFSGISGLSATDDGTKEFSLYATFKTIVNDNENLKFTVGSAIANPAGSTFAASDAGGAETDDSGNNNKLIVTADRLSITSPSEVVINADFIIEVEATDSNGSQDTDEISSVTLDISFGTGTITSITGLTQSLVSGYFIWTDIQYDVIEEFAIEAQSVSLANVISDTITASDAVIPGLILSKLCDPLVNFSTDRYIQIYNCSDQNIDLTAWSVVAVGNGSDIFTWSLSGIIKPGETKSCGDDENTKFTPDFIEIDWSTSNSTWNGGSNDGAKLVKSSDIIDEASDHGNFSNKVTLRNTDIISPSESFNGSEWASVAVTNADDYPSTHDLHLCEAPIISISSSGVWSTLTSGYGNGSSFIFHSTVTIDEEVSSPAMCYDLSLLSDAALVINPGKALTINGDLSMNDGTKSRGASTLTIESDATGNGSLIIVDGLTGGDITMQRYIPGYTNDEDGWHQISSPVSTMDISGSDFDPGENDDLFKWDEVGNIWDNYKNSGWDVSQFLSGEGYMIAYETGETKNFNGLLTNSDLAYSNLSATTGQGEGWHLLGNPFSSAIEWGTADWGLTNIESAAHIWNDQSGNYSLISTGDIIPSTNGFFIKATDPSNSINIPVSARRHDDQNNYKTRSGNKHVETLEILVTNDDNNYSDLNRIGFNSFATKGYDAVYDAHKLFGKEKAPQLWTMIDGEYIVQNYLPYIVEDFQLPLYFSAGVNTTYHFQFDGLDSFYENSIIYLEDLKSGDIIDLHTQQNYTFDADGQDNFDRFILHFFNVTDIINSSDSEDINIYSYENSIYISTNGGQNKAFHVEVFNSMGQIVYDAQKEPEQLTCLKLHQKPGVYIVRLRSKEKIFTQKLLLK